MTTVRYFVPEDGDNEDHPNIFLMPKPTQSGFSPRLRDIKDSFPMPGSYHFRFKCSLIPGADREKGAVPVWMDCVHDDQHVGVWRNTIFAKVTRINMEDDEDDEFARHSTTSNGHHAHVSNGNGNGHAHATNGHSRSNHQPAQPQPRVQQQPAGRVPTPPAPAPVPVPAVPESDILGVFDERPATLAPAASEGNLLDVPTSTGASLLDLGKPTYSHDDFLGMTSTPPVSGQTPAPSQIPAPAPASYGNPLNSGAGGGTGARPNMGGNKAYNSFKSNGPFGGLEWK